MYTWRMKISTQNLACSQRQIHTVHASRSTQAKTTEKTSKPVKYNSNCRNTHTHTQTNKKATTAERPRTKRPMVFRSGLIRTRQMDDIMYANVFLKKVKEKQVFCLFCFQSKQNQSWCRCSNVASIPLVYVYIYIYIYIYVYVCVCVCVCVTYRLLASSLCPEVTLSGWQGVKIQEVSA